MELPFGRYDDAIKAMVAARPQMLTQLLGIRVDGGAEVIERRSESLPPLSTRIVDSLLMTGSGEVVHIEFQAHGEPGFALRMLDYLVRLSELPELEGQVIDQHVVLLGGGRLNRSVRHRRLDYSFRLHELRAEPVDRFLADGLLAPFAVLAAVGGRPRTEVLAAALEVIDAIDDEQLRVTYALGAASLARIRLDPATITQTWKDAAMTIPNVFEEIRDEALQEGIEQGRAEFVDTLVRDRFPLSDEVQRRGAVANLALLPTDEIVRRIKIAESVTDLTS